MKNPNPFGPKPVIELDEFDLEAYGVHKRVKASRQRVGTNTRVIGKQSCGQPQNASLSSPSGLAKHRLYHEA